MRLSEAIRLGSLAIQNPQSGDNRYCALGMGLEAIGKRTMFGSISKTNKENSAALRGQWPWLDICPGTLRFVPYSAKIWLRFDFKVMRMKMTLEALCDQVRAWEDELEAKGINVEQVTMAAELTEPASQAAEHTKEVVNELA